MITSQLWQAFANRKAARIHALMRQSQFWDAEKLRAYQFEKLSHLLNHAYQNVPYYTQVFKTLGAMPQDFHDLESLKSFPVLTKSIIRKNFNDLISLDAHKRGLEKNSTGGSTGEPLTFYQDANYRQWSDAARTRGWYEVPGLRAGETMGVLWGATHEVEKDFSPHQRIITALTTGKILLNAFNMSHERQATFLKWLMRFKPKLIRGYFSAIVEFADYLEEMGVKLPWVKGVILCAETVDPDVQRRIESIYGAKSYNSYGGRELSLIAMECAEHRGLHEVSENNIVQFERIEGCWNEGLSELAITNLNNFGMPFIRYQIGDLGIASTHTDCPCGRGQPLIQRIAGRTTEILSFADGTRIAGEMFIHLMKDVGLKEYQFVQRTKSSITLRMRRKESSDEAIIEKINTTYRPFLPDSIELRIEPVERIEKTLTGKFRFVYSELSDGLEAN